MKGFRVRGRGNWATVYIADKVWATHFIGVSSESTLERLLAEHQRVVVLTSCGTIKHQDGSENFVRLFKAQPENDCLTVQLPRKGRKNRSRLNHQDGTVIPSPRGTWR